MVGLPDIVTCAALDGDRFDHFCVVGGRISGFPIYLVVVLTTPGSVLWHYRARLWCVYDLYSRYILGVVGIPLSMLYCFAGQHGLECASYAWYTGGVSTKRRWLCEVGANHRASSRTVASVSSVWATTTLTVTVATCDSSDTHCTDADHSACIEAYTCTIYSSVFKIFAPSWVSYSVSCSMYRVVQMFTSLICISLHVFHIEVRLAHSIFCCWNIAQMQDEVMGIWEILSYCTHCWNCLSVYLCSMMVFHQLLGLHVIKYN